jgi:hypothetical protein
MSTGGFFLQEYSSNGTKLMTHFKSSAEAKNAYSCLCSLQTLFNLVHMTVTSFSVSVKEQTAHQLIQYSYRWRFHLRPCFDQTGKYGWWYCWKKIKFDIIINISSPFLNIEAFLIPAFVLNVGFMSKEICIIFAPMEDGFLPRLKGYRAMGHYQEPTHTRMHARTHTHTRYFNLLCFHHIHRAIFTIVL